MSSNLLVDTLVKQMMVMVGRLATAQGKRTPLSHVADKMFLDLGRVLEDSGVKKKIVADMFGMTLRAYQYKMLRLHRSAAGRSRTLWQSVATFIEQEGNVLRTDVERRFAREEPKALSSVLHDLEQSQVIEVVGRGKRSSYRSRTTEALSQVGPRSVGFISILWVVIHRHGVVSKDDLKSLFPSLHAEELQTALEQLETSGRIKRSKKKGKESFSSTHFEVLPGEINGWEGAVVDHFQAVVNTICGKVEQKTQPSSFDDREGGSTYHFDIDPRHPHYEKVFEFFKKTREEASALRQAVDVHNTAERKIPVGRFRTTLYLGQYIVKDLVDPWDSLETEENDHA